MLQSNAADPGAAKTLVDNVKAKYGRIDVLFVNAGIARLVPIEQVEEAAFEEVFSTNLRGPYFLLKHAASVLAEGASVILTSSTSAVLGMSGASAYAASKAALRSLGISLAVEFAPRHIRVNTITPGPIETPSGAKMGLTAEQLAGFGQMIAHLPLNSMGQPEEIAGWCNPHARLMRSPWPLTIKLHGPFGRRPRKRSPSPPRAERVVFYSNRAVSIRQRHQR